MVLMKLIEFADSDNLLEELDDTQRQKLAEDVLRRAHEDRDSMGDWEEAVKTGLELCKPEFKAKDDPWPGAANYKSMIMAEAANDFGNRCKTELMRERDLVKTEIIGQRTLKNVIERTSNDTSIARDQLEKMTGMLQQLQASGGQPDPQLQEQLAQLQQYISQNEDKILAIRGEVKQKDQRADRVTEAMNWAVNNKMPTWREDHCDMMYRLPLSGTAFKKTTYNDLDGCYESEVIMYPDFYVNQATKHLDSARSFTHIIAVSKSVADRRMRDGKWLDVPLYAELEDDDAGSDEAEKVEQTNKNPERFYEQFCWYDLDEDGIEEPYIVTVHVASEKAVRMVARYDESTIKVRSANEGFEFGVLPIHEARMRVLETLQKDAKNLNVEPSLPDPEDYSMFEVVSVKPELILTKYGFMKSVDNTFLDVGLFHWIGPRTMTVNRSTNDLLNAAKLANLQTGFAAKGFRKKSGPITLKPGEIKQTEIPAEQLQGSIRMMDFKEPSQTLFNLRDGMENESRGFAINVDQAVQSNTAPTTALAMVQESLQKQTAHVSLIVDSMSSEFKILFGLLRSFMTNIEYQQLTGDDQASMENDFSLDGLSISCGANPEMSSKMQRMMLAMAELEQVPLVTQAGGNPIPIIKNYFERIGSEDVTEIFPNEAEMSPEEKAQMQQMQQLQQQQVQMQQAQLQLTQLQTELLQKGEQRKDFEAQSEAQEREVKMRQMMEDMLNEKIESRSRSILNLEKAESEQVKNQIDMYTARSGELDKAEAAAQRQVDAEIHNPSGTSN